MNKRILNIYIEKQWYMKCTHLYLNIVRFHLKMLEKKIIKDFNVKLIWQLSENGRVPLNILNHGQTRMHSFFTAKRTLFTMKCTHVYLKRVRIPLKILDKKFIKDFNINLIGNYQKMVELLWISLITAKRPNGQTTKPPNGRFCDLAKRFSLTNQPEAPTWRILISGPDL